MPLPKIDLPLYELELPISGEKIKYRPFTGKEEKILLLAQETEDVDQMFLSIKQVVNNCINDKDVEELPMLDIEYLMILLRSKSVDNTVDFMVTDPETEEKVKLSLDLNNIKIHRNEKHSNMIRLNEEYVLQMRYPTVDEFASVLKHGANNNDNNYKVMVSCMDMLLSKDEVFKFKDFSEAEKDEFASNLSSDVLLKIRDFFETMPTIRHEIKYKNKNGNDKTFVIEGLQSFFI